MPKLQCYGERPCILLTNDDGPPCSSSPNIFGFAKLIQERLGWDVKVVIPDRQKSWVGKAYAISEIITTSYFYPLEPDGLQGEITTHPRPLRDGESMEWTLLAGTPASCANIALHNLYPGQIDLVISGPNHGRNSSTAFALSSGTLGAALATALSPPIPGPSSAPSLHTAHMPAIALSYGVVERPVPPGVTQAAHEVSVEAVSRLFDDWGTEEDGQSPVQVYSINVPLIAASLEKNNRKICWTEMRRNTYGQLFKSTHLDPKLNWWKGDSRNPTASSNPPLNATPTASAPPVTNGISSTPDCPDESAGPGALPPPTPDSPTKSHDNSSQPEQLKFHFAPDIQPLVSPSGDIPYGTDAWALAKGYISVTPLKAEFSGVVPAGRDSSRKPGEMWS